MFDSRGGRLPKRSVKLVADLLQTKEEAITFEFVDVQKPVGGSDCGLFTITFITSISNCQDPTVLRYNQSAIILLLLSLYISYIRLSVSLSVMGGHPKSA